jgi:diguanylate cyclase (GGDEF)-like protein
VKPIVLEEGIRSFIVLPLPGRERVIGAMFVFYHQEHSFSDDEVHLLTTIANQAAVAIENARLFEAERQQRQESETLREAALALTTTLDRNQVIERILGQLQQVVPYDSASVQLLKGDRLEIIGGRGFPNLPELLGISFPVDGDNPNRQVVRARAPFILQDAPAVYEGFRQEPFVQMGIRSWLGVPMLVGERLIGMIALDKREPGFYTEQYARLALAFATQAAIAIENARLYEEERRRATQLAVVSEVSRHASSTLELEEILRRVTTAIQTGFGYYDVAAFLVEGEYAVLKAIAGGFTEIAKDGCRLHLSQGIIGWAITHGQTVLANDVSRDPRFVSAFPGEEAVIRSELCVPIRVDGEVLGALGVESAELNAFDQWDVMALEILADQVALACKNALAYGRLDEEKGRLELLYQVAAEVNRSLNLDQILARAIESITANLGGKVGYVFLLEPGTDRLRLRAVTGVEVPLSRLDEILDLHLGQGLVGWVAAHGQAAVVDDVTQDERWLYVDELDRGVRSVMSVPLVRGEEVLGALSVLHPTLSFFTEARCLLLMAIAQQVAMAVANARLYETVRQQAMLDSLTQVYNHGELIGRLHATVEEAAKKDQPVSFIMLDIDYFKEYNDRYGHVIGDLILTAIVQAIWANIKRTDVVGRWGGEEFGIVLPRTNSEQAQVVAERIRRTLAAMPLTDDRGREVPKPTVSQGISTYPATAASAEELIDRADAALYQAKVKGKDQVHAA